MISELPPIAKSAYASNAIGLASFCSGIGGNGASAHYSPGTPSCGDGIWEDHSRFRRAAEIENLVRNYEQSKENEVATSNRRIVKVIIIDPDERVPLDKCILYSGAEKLTDLTDQELFFEIEIKALLDAHNTYRGTLVNDLIKERTEYLKPIKIRDLRMVVVDVAKF